MFALLEEEKGAGGALGARLGCQLPFPGWINSHLLCLPPPQSSSSPAHLPGVTHEPRRGRANLPSGGMVLGSRGVRSANPPSPRVPSRRG